MTEAVQIAQMMVMATAGAAVLGTVQQFLQDLGAMTADLKRNKTRTALVREEQMTRNIHQFRLCGDVL